MCHVRVAYSLGPFQHHAVPFLHPWTPARQELPQQNLCCVLTPWISSVSHRMLQLGSYNKHARQTVRCFPSAPCTACCQVRMLPLVRHKAGNTLVLQAHGTTSCPLLLKPCHRRSPLYNRLPATELPASRHACIKTTHCIWWHLSRSISPFNHPTPSLPCPCNPIQNITDADLHCVAAHTRYY